MGDFEQMLNDLCKMSKAQLVQMVRNTDEVEIALNIFKNVMKEDYARKSWVPKSTSYCS